MNILISNDDGWDAAGIGALLEVAKSFGNCTVVAPATEQSGVSHQITLFRTLKLTQQSEDVWSVDGTPADCVRVALTQLKTSFDLVLSGINNGGNLGADIHVSGTVAAAREAALFGLPAIAISQHRLRYAESFDWKWSKVIAARVLQHCLDAGLQKRELVNINLPDFSDSKPGSDSEPEPEIVDPCPLDPSPRPAIFESRTAQEATLAEGATLAKGTTLLKSVARYNDRSQSPGHDVATCFSKRIPVTRLKF